MSAVNANADFFSRFPGQTRDEEDPDPNDLNSTFTSLKLEELSTKIPTDISALRCGPKA